MRFEIINDCTILFYISAYNYKKHRKNSIQDDLNKLYDNRPTISSIEDDGHSAKYHRVSKEERGKKTYRNKDKHYDMASINLLLVL